MMAGNKIKLDDSSKKYIEAFEHFDKDYDGYLSIEDIINIMRKLGKRVDEGQLQDLITALDPNGKGLIDAKEFLNIMKRREKDPNCDDDYLEIFKIIDTDKNQLIGASELYNYFSALDHKISEEETEEMILEKDSDGDGYITFKEFVKILKEEEESE